MRYTLAADSYSTSAFFQDAFLSYVGFLLSSIDLIEKVFIRLYAAPNKCESYLDLLSDNNNRHKFINILNNNFRFKQDASTNIDPSHQNEGGIARIIMRLSRCEDVWYIGPDVELDKKYNNIRQAAKSLRV